MSAELSFAKSLARELVRRHGAAAHEVLEQCLEKATSLELAAALYDWEGLFARPKQVIPLGGRWRSYGFLTGRGFGKTRSIAEYINEAVRAGKAKRIALIAQNEDKTAEVMVDGPAGLIETAPPWFRPVWEHGQIVWPNGAEAFIYTPEVPGSLRGPEHDLAWASELIAWPAVTRDEAWSNLRFGLRKGAGRMLWDTTPKRRHPLIRYLLARHRKYPELHVVVRGAMSENRDNLTPEVVAELEEEYGGTQRGLEELEGVYFDEAAGALWKEEWFEPHRRNMPTKLARRVISIDPAISTRKGTDHTGFIDAGLGIDGQAYVIEDHSDHHEWDAWGDLAVEKYVDGRCDLVVIETNRGGDACAGNIRRAAKDIGLGCVIVDDKHTPRHVPGVVHVREIRARMSKEARADPVAGRYQRGKVSHVRGANLEELEDELTTWDPNESTESPNRLDALVHAVCELLGLVDDKPDRKKNFEGIGKLADELRKPVSGSLSSLLLRGGGRSSGL